MSRVSENLRVHRTNNTYAKIEPLSFVSFKEEPSYLSPSDLFQYKLSCVIESTFIADEFASKEKAIERTKRAIMEEIFGEFRRDLYELENALYNYNIESAKKHLDNVTNNMFDY